MKKLVKGLESLKARVGGDEQGEREEDGGRVDKK